MTIKSKDDKRQQKMACPNAIKWMHIRYSKLNAHIHTCKYTEIQDFTKPQIFLLSHMQTLVPKYLHHNCLKSMWTVQLANPIFVFLIYNHTLMMYISVLQLVASRPHPAQSYS